MDLPEQIGEYIRREALLEPKQRLLVAVSGGPDSLCLMDCLHRLGFRLVIAHLDHRLRPESHLEAEFVRGVAGSYGLPAVIETADLQGHRGSLEEAARLERYRFLARVARRRRVRTIAVGHTADDQVETVLMHLLRGAGPAGLRGMLPRTPLDDWRDISETNGLTLVRPLLEVRRHQTESHCAAVGMIPMQDPSNQDPRFFRNRLRHELIPQLHSYNPEIEDLLLRTAKVMAAETDLISDLVEARWGEWVREAGPGTLALQRERLLQAPLALQRAALRRAILVLRPGLRDVGFEAIERGLEGLQAGRRQTLIGELDLLPVGREVILRRQGAAIAFPELPQLISTRERRLSVPGAARLGHGWRIELAVVKRKPRRGVPRSQAWFDRERLPGPLVMRPPKPGDRFQPLGMTGSMRLADLFTNRKIARPARELWPVVCSGDALIWVAGLHVSRVARPSRTSRRLLELNLRRPGK
ncbi:MAG: tRNA lysidine(34) synthetase TilS [Chloroflexota bacterium]